MQRLKITATWSLRCITRRTIHISSQLESTSKSPLFQLRQKTGLAYNLCREALDKHNNDVQKAETWLQAQALAHGLQKATKIRDRSAREGLISLAIRHDNKLATLVELNCETDFVAKNQFFRDFAISITEQIASNTDNCSIAGTPEQTMVERFMPTETIFKDIETQIAPLISRLGENIKMRRAYHFNISDKQCRLFGQIHSKSGSKGCDNFDVMTGRYGAIVALKNLDELASTDEKLPKQVGDRLCHHVIGYSPTYIELPEGIRTQLEEAEREAKEQSERADSDSSLQDDEGQLEPTSRSRDDWPSIMDQSLILSDDMTVRDFCESQRISIVYFNRFECGENL